MFTLSIENLAKEKIILTNNVDYVVTDIQGLNPPSSTINISKKSGMDGGVFNSSYMDIRNIVLTIKIRGNIETNRLKLYKFFKSKQYCKLFFEHSVRKVFIEGYIESFVVDLFSNNQECHISILCPQPYFMNAKEIITSLSRVINLFEFPFSIEKEGIEYSRYEPIYEMNVKNHSDTQMGFVLNMRAKGNVSSPAIYNIDTNEYFKLDFEMIEGDNITINTIKGNKQVMLSRSGEEINIFNYVSAGSTFMQLSQGDNLMTYHANAGNEFLDINFKLIYQYEGV